MSPTGRLAVRLMRSIGLTWDQAARALGVSVSTVRRAVSERDGRQLALMGDHGA